MSCRPVEEVASYIYAADGATPRGGPADEQMGRKAVEAKIPVYNSGAFARRMVLQSYVVCSGRDVKFSQRRRLSSLNSGCLTIRHAVTGATSIFDDQAEGASFRPDEVMMFSGGWTLPAGAMEAA